MKLTPREWLISIILHVTVLGLLIWFKPARDILTSLTQKNPATETQPPHQDPAQVQQAVQSISEEQTEEAREHVNRLLDLEKKLDEMTKARLDDYHKQEQEIASDAAKKALDQLQQIPAGQDATLKAQDQLNQQLQNLLPTGTDATPDPKTLPQIRSQLSALKETIGQEQVKTQEEQEKAAQLIHFLGTDSSAAQLQQKANDAQNTAALNQQNAAKSQDQLLNNLNTQITQKEAVARENEALAKIQAEIDAANAAIVNQQPAVDAAKVPFDAATTAFNQARDYTTAFNQARDYTAADKKPEDRKAQDAAHMIMQRAQQTYNQAKSQQDRNANQVKSLQARLHDEQGRLQQATNNLATTRLQFAPLRTRLQTALDASRNDQASARQAQVDAIAGLTAAANAPTSQPPISAEPRELATDKEPAPATLLDKDLGQVYEAARQTEDRITDKYKVYRAAEFASIQKLTLADALQATQVAKPNREKLDPQLLSGKGAVRHFAAYKSEVVKSHQQIQSMVDLTSEMVATAVAQENVGRGDVSLQEDQYNQMVSSALDDPHAAGKDLTQITRNNGGEGQSTPGQGQGTGNANQAANPAKPNSPSGHAGEFARNASELPTMDPNLPQGFATRQISENGPHYSGWIYVDSWYLIGPFPNERRDNLYTKFPPESVIDLDAVYPGKSNRPLRWVYTQWNSPKLQPPNDSADAPAIYYAYTELNFDQPEDLWIATGSDDKGTMWLNNVMVWNSNDVLKGWHPNEGYRKVHFSQGRNRILYRLENGQQTAVFSLMISSRKN
jgi:hypothetical protein